MPSHVLKINKLFQNYRIFILLYLRSIDDYSLLDTFDKYQFLIPKKINSKSTLYPDFWQLLFMKHPQLNKKEPV